MDAAPNSAEPAPPTGNGKAYADPSVPPVQAPSAPFELPETRLPNGADGWTPE